MLVISKAKTTRDDDLDFLDEGISIEGEDRKDGLRMIREMVYEQSKDETLEVLRKQLTEAVIRGDMQRVKDIEIKVKTYSKTPTFRHKMALALSRTSRPSTKEKAERIFKAHV